MTRDETVVGGGRAAAGGLPVVASDWLRQRLQVEDRTGQVVGAGERAAYVRFGPSGERDTWVLAIERHDAVGLPCGVRIPAPAATPIPDVGARVRPDGATIAVVGRAAPMALQVVRWQRAVPVVAAPDRPALARRLGRLVGAGHPELPWWPSHVSPPPDRLRIGAGRLARLDAAGVAVDDLVGWGPGSTPSGDDLLAGFIATLRCLPVDGPPADAVASVASTVVRRAPGRTTDLSATLLACAVDGAVALPAAGFLRAVTAPDTTVDRMQAALDHLLRIGHTSGHDLALGILAALHVAATSGTRAVAAGTISQPSELQTTRSH